MTRTATRDASIFGGSGDPAHELAGPARRRARRSPGPPQLCAGWRVRHLAALMPMPLRYSTRQFIAEMIRTRGLLI